MHWQRLDRDSTIKTIESVKSASDPGLFSAASSEVERARLPFYENVDAYKITNFASLPSFTFEYLGQGEFFHYLDGTELPIYTVNDKGALVLNDKTVVDYLEFFFSRVTLDDDEMFLIQNAHDMPHLDSLDRDSISAVTKNHRAPRVEYDGGFDRYTVEADLYAEGLLMRATIEVTSSGRVTLGERRMIVNAIAQSYGSGIMAE